MKDVGNLIFAWKDGNQFKLYILEKGKKGRVECIKKRKIQYKLDNFRKEGWDIVIKKPQYLTSRS